MDDKRKLTGHPWHIEFLKMAEDDTRRHKKRCIHYSQNNSCRKICGTCIGSSHCSFYKESGAEQLSRKQIEKTSDAEQLSREQIEKMSGSKQLSKKQIEKMLSKIFGEV